jgi:hypothetical protein
MLPGLNHNVRFKGIIYHVQTEDSGVEKPHIITVLYEGGRILARKRTSYADMVSAGQIGDLVKDLMLKQHKEMLRLLKSGAFEEPAPAAAEQDLKEGAAPTPPPPAPGPVQDLNGEGSLDEVILDFVTGGSAKKRSSGDPAR